MLARFHSRRPRQGFSLVEVMMVLAIIMIVSVLALPQFLKVQQTAYEASAVSFLRTLQTDQESYRMANGFYSDNFDDLGLTARGPDLPGDLFNPDGAPRSLSAQLPRINRPGPLLAAIFPPAGLFSTADARQEQEGQPQTPPPKKRRDPKFGAGKDDRDTKVDPGGTTNPAGLPPGGAGGRRPRRRGEGGAAGSGGPVGGAGAGGSGSSTGGAASSGGGSGGAGSGQPGATPGSGGSFAPSSEPPPKTNVLVKHNYVFRLHRPSPTTWWCDIQPIRDRGNSKFFFIDQTGIIRSEVGKPADSSSPQL